jgi:hypothetical protein
MPTAFEFSFVFRAPSAEAVLRGYFDAELLAMQDKVAELTERTVVEEHEDDVSKTMTWSVRSTRNLPFFVKPFVEGGRLSFKEYQRWRKADDEVDMTVTPQILGGRFQIAGTYRLTKTGEGQIHRRYDGTITANMSLVSGKIERGILEEFTKGVPAMADCTQRWLDR